MTHRHQWKWLALLGAICLAVGVYSAAANTYCALCTDDCVSSTGVGCEVYYATPNVRTRVSCPPGTNTSSDCHITATTGCYTTYRVCTQGHCGADGCVDEGGCSTYTYPNIDAASTYTGPTKCI